MLHKKINFTKKPLNELDAQILFSYANTDFLPIKGGVYQSLVDYDKEIAVDCSRKNLRVGTALVSPGRSLPYKSICHFAICGISNDPSESSIQSAMRYGFQLISETRESSYVLPALSEEGGGMPVGLCAGIVLREVLIFAENKFVEKITIQAKNQKEYSDYMSVFKSMVK